MLPRTPRAPRPKPTLPTPAPKTGRSPVPTRGELVVALGSALFAAMVVTNVAQGLQGWHRRALVAELDRRAQDVSLPVLLRPLAMGDVVRAEDVGRRPFPASLVPERTVEEGEELVGRTVLETVLAGEPIREDRLAPVGAAPGLEAVVPQGLRAISVNVRDDDQVSGFVTPGARVDVLATLSVAGSLPTETVTLLEAVQVLAVKERVDHRSTGEPVVRPQVTLALTPQDAVRLTAVPRAPQQLKLTLRADVDFDVVEPEPVRTADLLGPERVTVRQFRERYSEDDVREMAELVDRVNNPVRSPIIAVDQIRDPRL